jgi:hypothetical protein
MSGVRAKDDAVALGTAIEPTADRPGDSPADLQRGHVVLPAMEPAEDGRMTWKTMSHPPALMVPQWSQPRDAGWLRRVDLRHLFDVPQWSRPRTGRIMPFLNGHIGEVDPAAMEQAEDGRMTGN